MAPKKKSPKVKVNLDIKYTSFGTTCESVIQKDREDADSASRMRYEIEDTVRKISASPKALVSHRFYLVHANYYIEYTAEKRNIPCEVAIAEYSIAEGVLRSMHFFPPVDTPNGMLPSGYKANYLDHSESTHKIPEPPFEAARTQFDDLSADVISFLTQNGVTDIPPVYTMPDNEFINHSQTTVVDFFDIIEDFSRARIKVFELPALASHLYSACSNFATACGPQPDEETRSALVNDKYFYTQGLSCIFHETLENVEFCSQSTVFRWAFIISDFCTKPVGVVPIPGRHCPDKAFAASLLKKREEKRKRDAAPVAGTSSFRSTKSGTSRGTADEPSTGSCFRRPEPEGDVRIYKVGSQAGVVSEIRVDKPEPLVQGTGVRLPKTKGRGFTIMATSMNQDPGGFTKYDFPPLGGRGSRGSARK